MPRVTKTPIDRVQLIADAYVGSVLGYCESHKLPVQRAVASLLNRPQAVRVAKMASFTISGTPVSTLLSTEELYYATNKAYNQFKRQNEVQVDGIVNDELLKALKA